MLNYLTVEETAKLLHRSIRSIHELTRTSAIPHRRYGRRCLLLAEEIAAWLEGAELETIPLPNGGRCVRPKSKAAA